MEKRVVITGMGAVTPIGNNINEYWNGLKNGKNGIDFITSFDTDDMKVKIAGEVKDFDPTVAIEKKEVKRMDKFCQYALSAAKEAVDMSKVDINNIDNHRFGVIIGSGIGGLGVIEQQVIKMHDKGPSKVAPLFIPMAIGNMAAGNVAIKFNARGICTSIVTACASSNNCIGEAYRNIKHGYSDLILAGGSESSVTKIGISGFSSLKTLSATNDPSRASIPFDKERNGFVMGEGAGVVMVEEYEHAVKRGANILCEIVGYGATCDAYHMTSPILDGEGTKLAMEAALKEGNVDKSEVGYINAHGTSTPINDLAETLAIKALFKEEAYNLAVSSTKSMTGHLLGATGAVEAIATVEALIHDFIPPTINYKVKDEELDLNYVPNKGIDKKLKYALSNSMGFGGHNAVICLKKWEDK